MIKGVLFDLIGTTVKEGHNDTVIGCLESAFLSFGIVMDKEFLVRNRGKDKIVMIREALKMKGLPESRENDIYIAFKKNIAANIEKFTASDGASEIFEFLQIQNIKIGIGTGLERSLFEMIYAEMRWETYSIDYIGISSEIGRSRPHPDMIFDFMNKTGIKELKEILKVGDTVADIMEGKNAGVHTAVILSGSQPESDLSAAGADYIIRSLLELKIIITSLYE